MTRIGLSALVLSLAAPAGPARAGFQPVPIRLPAFRNTTALTAPLGSGGAGDDLLLAQWGYGGATRHYRWRELATPRTSPYATPVADATDPVLNATAGDFDGDGLPDLFFERPGPILTNSDVEIAWGAEPGLLRRYWPALSEVQLGVQALQILPPPAPQVLVTSHRGDYTEWEHAEITLRDLRPLPSTGSFTGLYRYSALFAPWVVTDDYGGRSRVFRLRLGLPGRPAGIDDVLVPLRQGLRILVNGTPAGATTLNMANFTRVTVGWLEPSDLPARRAEPGVTVPVTSSCHGGAALDVDGDGLRDLVFAMVLGADGQLLWIRGTGVPLDFGAYTSPWRSLMAWPGLPAFENPMLVREIELPDGPATVVHDVGLDELVVLSRDAGGLRAQRLPARGAAAVHDMWAADVVGEAGVDLLASVVTAEGAQEVWVYPDDGALSPTLAWNPAPPEVALLGTDLTLSVDASDPDSPFALRWIRPPLPDALDVETLVIPGAEICGTDPVEVTVRALDAVGLYAELRASIPVAVRPSLVLVGADPPGRLVLAPGGVAGRAVGTAWPACGSAPSFAWGSPGLPGLDANPGADGSRAWLDFTLPESAYPAALSTPVPGEPALTLTATEGSLSGTATLPLELDARGLVAATATFDRASLDAGEVGSLRVELASRLSVPLPGVRVRVRLDGLDFAGAPAVVGAPWAPAAAPGEVVLDPLPAGPASVALSFPVRSGGAPGGASVELFSASGVRLSPEADPPAGDEVVPGCGCGTGSGVGWAVALPLLLARRRRAT